MAHIHRIGEPENESEQKAVRSLAKTLPDDFYVIHNFELTTGHGLPYEYDVVVVGEFAVYHVEVKGYRGTIRGDKRQWVFENGGVYPSPIPLANKKTKILASQLKRFSRRMKDVWVETVVLLTDDRARIRIRDDQSHRVISLDDAYDHMTDPSALPVRPTSIGHLHNPICEVLLGSRPSRKVKEIGLYDVLEKINQSESRTVFLAEHKYIKTRPKTILKVHHIDLYASKEEQERHIQAIFHDQEALRQLSGHPNIIQTGDIFAWSDDQFVLPTHYVEQGRTLEMLLDREEDRSISWAEKRDIIEKTARGLRHAHRGGVIHRDVRPLNVVVAPSGEVKLVNFDLAYIKSAPGGGYSPPDLKQRLDPRYTAPEVWRDPNQASEQSDVYSLGLLFYELITSEAPHEHVDEVIEREGVPLNVDLLLSELSTPESEDFMDHPLDAAGIIERMCAYDPKERYESMDEVMEDLSLVE